MRIEAVGLLSVISIHPPRAGWDYYAGQHFRELRISIHPPRAGWDSFPFPGKIWDTHFNPPTQCGVGHILDGHSAEGAQFQSTHPVRGGTCAAGDKAADGVISIHPPRAGWDVGGRGIDGL